MLYLIKLDKTDKNWNLYNCWKSGRYKSPLLRKDFVLEVIAYTQVLDNSNTRQVGFYFHSRIGSV